MSSSYLNIPLIIVAIILGVTIFKHFDFETLTFKKTWLDLVYVLAFIITLLLLFKKKVK